MNLGEKLKEKRQKFQLTQQEVAEKMHVSRQTISNWEVGRSYPDIESLIQLSELFNVSLDVLLKGDKKMITSLKRKNIWEVIYIAVISALAVSVLICMSIDFIYTRQLTWSLIVAVSCLIGAAPLTIARYAETQKLVKSSLLISLLLIPLMVVVHWYAPQTDLTQMLAVTGVWVGYGWLLLVLWLSTAIGFWQFTALALLLSVAGEGTARLVSGLPVMTISFIFANAVEVILAGGLLVCGILRVDKGKLNQILGRR